MSDASLLYPRLLASEAGRLADELRDAEVEKARRAAKPKHDAVIYTATGGARVSREHLVSLQDAVRAEAQRFGYPESAPRSARTDADAPIAEELHKNMELLPGEAAKGGVWTFLTCVLLPDVVRWRFPGSKGVTARNRFTAGRRNAFGRLWWRAEVLSAGGDYRLLRDLNEDEQVQLFERSGLYGYRELTWTMAERFLALDRHLDLANRRNLLRDAQKRITRFSSFVSLGALQGHELTALIDEALRKAGQALDLFDQWPQGLTSPAAKTEASASSEHSESQTKGQAEEGGPNLTSPSDELDKLSRHILDVLPIKGEGLSASEVATQVNALESGLSADKTAVNRRLYKALSDHVESHGSTPPRWHRASATEGESTDGSDEVSQHQDRKRGAGSLTIVCSTTADEDGFGVHLSIEDDWPADFPAEPAEAVEIVSLVTRHQYRFIATGEPQHIRPLSESEIAERTGNGRNAVEEIADRISLDCGDRDYSLKQLIPGAEDDHQQ